MSSDALSSNPVRPGDKLNCPRLESSNPGFRYENKPDDGNCDYCGSLLGDDFMGRIEAGDVILTPTDKPYKVYVTNAGGEPFMRSSRTDDGSSGLDQSKWVWETRENPMPKFYFQHLSQGQQRIFIELFNEKKLKLDYPGHFYKVPYFIEIKSGDSK